MTVKPVVLPDAVSNGRTDVIIVLPLKSAAAAGSMIPVEMRQRTQKILRGMVTDIVLRFFLPDRTAREMRRVRSIRYNFDVTALNVFCFTLLELPSIS